MALIGCNSNFLLSKMCAIFIFSVFGYDREQFTYTQLPVIVSHILVSLSTKTVEHITQEIQSGKFRRYDYGATKNLLIYNSIEPPDYDLSSVKVPIAIFYANNDFLVDPISIMQVLFHGEIFPQDVYNTLMTLIGRNLNFIKRNIAPIISYLRSTVATQSSLIIHLPAASLKTVVHFVQRMQSCKFRQYDYGAMKNLIMYKSVEPPEYNLSNIALPMAIYYGNNDLMVAPIIKLHIKNQEVSLKEKLSST
ncbi:lipase 3-like [Nylanderia fulva]|uniref:lipase 3-like n=1 Tax=Nylanderia fulva TaxID=613905 RepID=UPI0010FAF330|nr:lipase 3-like [Nylanderia fulva]